MKKYILALDAGTTSNRALLFDQNGAIVDIEQQEFTQHFPKAGWVEHDPNEIWQTQSEVIRSLIRKSGVSPADIAALGITNQRETAVVWDKHTGEPICNAIVWQDRRTARICNDLKDAGLEPYVREKTGLVIDAYFSGTKIKWILDNVEGARAKADNGDLLFGTVDTWLVWKLTGGKVHATDYTNVSRTMLFDIQTLDWDDRLLQELGVPRSMLPEVRMSAGYFGEMQLDGATIPITGIAGDQQAALFGQACFEPGMAKNTYGTGCFMLMNTGEEVRHSSSGMLTTIAWGIGGKVEYAMEGSIFIAGAAVQWLRDGLKIIQHAAETEQLAEAAKGDREVFVVPAFVGLGGPYWDMQARGAIFGLTRDTSREHIVRATLESIAYQTKDILLAMQEDTGIQLQELRVDGGSSANNYLMQFQADMLGVPIDRPEIIESTALGVAYLASLGAGFWTKEQIEHNRKTDRTFTPALPVAYRDQLYDKWKEAVKRSMNWVEK